MPNVTDITVASNSLIINRSSVTFSYITDVTDVTESPAATSSDIKKGRCDCTSPSSPRSGYNSGLDLSGIPRALLSPPTPYTFLPPPPNDRAVNIASEDSFIACQDDLSLRSFRYSENHLSA